MVSVDISADISVDYRLIYRPIRKKYTSHKCCAATLRTNRSDNRKYFTFHAFPKDPNRRIEWEVKMKRSDGKFKSNSSLFCCSEHFVSEDYKHSLTGKRSDLRPQAVLLLFLWTKHQESNDERAKRSDCKMLM